MIPLPPLNFTGGQASGGTAGGGNAWSQGDWSSNVSGSAPSLQAAMGGSSLIWIAVAVGAAWLLLRK